mmetsp:Transcript_21325/g.30674  ORF Transcript_21325/g.30674 Transcript_21325/m.30674 type:complete len:83 (+) Transcript_21325:127-375(+)
MPVACADQETRQFLLCSKNKTYYYNQKDESFAVRRQVHVDAVPNLFVISTRDKGRLIQQQKSTSRKKKMMRISMMVHLSAVF